MPLDWEQLTENKKILKCIFVVVSHSSDRECGILSAIMAEIHPCEFDKLLTISVPHILEKIFFSLDYKSLKNCHEVCTSWKELLTSVPFQTKAQSMYSEAKQYNEKKLDYFSMQGNAKKVCHLLAIGVDPDCKFSKTKYPPLYWSIIKGHPDVTKLLLQAGVDPNKALPASHFGGCKFEGDLPLYLAACFGNTDVVQLLLNAGADPNVENETHRWM